MKNWSPILVLPVLLAYKLKIFPFITEMISPPELYWLNIPGIPLLLFAPLLLILNHRRRFISAFLIYAFFSLVIVVQILYMRYYTRPFSIHVLLQLGNLQGLGPSIWSIISWREILLLCDIPVLLFIFRKIPSSKENVRKKMPAALMILTALFMISLGPAKDKFIFKRDIVNIWREEVNLASYNVIGYYFLDLAVTLTSRLNDSLTPGEIKEVTSWMKENQKNYLPKKEDTLFGCGKHKNVIVIQCEALAGFAIDCSYNGKEITPNLNRLIGESIYFSNYHCQNFHGGSSDAEFILFTSLLPPLKGSTFFRFPNNRYLTLPELLKQRGYTTLAIHGNQSSFWNRGESYPSMKVDTFHDAQKLFGKSGWVNNDRKVFEKGADIIKNQKEPFFSILITIETHLGGDLTNVEGYLRAVEKLDNELGLFIKNLKSSGLYDRSLLVVYGDHPPYLDYETIKKSKKEFAWILKPGRKIPMIIRVPGIKKRKIEKLTAHVDAYPAIAHIMGINPDKYAGKIMGKNPFTSNADWALIYPDQYLSNEKDTPLREVSHRKAGFHIADKIIRSDFFKQYRVEKKRETSDK